MSMSFLYRVFLEPDTELQPFQLRTLQRDPPDCALPTGIDLERKIIYYYAPDETAEFWEERFTGYDGKPLTGDVWTRECRLLLTAARELDNRLLRFSEKMWLPNAVLRADDGSGERLLLPALPCAPERIRDADKDYTASETVFERLGSMLTDEHRALLEAFRKALRGGDFAQARFLLDDVSDEPKRSVRRKLVPRHLVNEIKEYFHKIQSDRNMLKRASEQTVPLATDDLYYRLAMISEGYPDEPRSERGLVSYILIDEFIIGRDPYLCDLVLDSPAVGRLHARIIRHGSHYFVEDLGSTNATYLNDKRLKKRTTYLLPDRARLRFADRSFYFTVESDFN